MKKELAEIQYDDLVKHLINPTSDLEHYLQYLVESTNSDRLAPEFEPNPTKVSHIPPTVEGGVGMGFANWFMRLRRHGDYRNKLAQGWDGPRIVSEGDSWFQYPTTLKDIIDHLMEDHAILSLGAAGDKLSDIENQREILKRIKAERASALLLSAGGNDLFAKGNLGRLIESPFPGAKANDLVGSVAESFVRDLLARLRDLFRRVHLAFPNVHILIHGYCPAFPQAGVWVEGPLSQRGVPKDQHRDIIRLILNKFNGGLDSLAASPEFQNRVEHIDATHIGSSLSDWYDEIHLNGESSKKVAGMFRQALQRRFAMQASNNVPLPVRPNVEEAVREAKRLSVFDEPTLSRELDLRVELAELDPSFGHAIGFRPLVLGAEQPEVGLASIKNVTRRLMRYWENELRELICCDSADTEISKQLLKYLGETKKLLAGAITAWIVNSPLSVPIALSSALGAWLASKLFGMGEKQVCYFWQSDTISSPALLVGRAKSNPATTVGEARGKFSMPDGSMYSTDNGKEVLENAQEILQKRIVENPGVPIGSNDVESFTLGMRGILSRLGADSDDALLSESELVEVESLILIDGSRPALYIKDGFIDLSDSVLDDSGRGRSWRESIVSNEPSIRRTIASSGRIIRGSDRSADNVYGSAWMIDGGQVVTARHVLEAMSFQDGTERRLNDIYHIDFAVEADRLINENSTYRVEGIGWVGPDEINNTVNPKHLDAAVLTLARSADREFPPALPLASVENSELFDGDSWILNIGHPGKPFGPWLVDGDDNNSNTISRAILFELIGNKFGVKRFSPGKIKIGPGIYAGDEVNKHLFTHDATTLGGSSGSVLVSFSKDTPVVGLHFAGLFGTRNYAHLVPKVSKNWQMPMPITIV